MDVAETKADWPARAWGLALLGAAIGLGIHLLTDKAGGYGMTDDPLRLAAATFLGVAGLSFAVVLERVRIGWSAAFALVAGLVIAAVIYWNGGPGRWEADDGWRLFCAVLAVGIAGPLFQTIRDGALEAGKGHGLRALPYPAVHDHGWTNVVLVLLALVFVGVVWLLAWLLASLFNLIGIDLLQELLRKDWFGWMMSGAAMGAAIGLLRDHDRVVAMLQRVAMLVLSVLAPVLGAGLLIFLIATLFTGLEPLWAATRDTTPILLSACAGALILANAVIGDSPEDEARSRPLRWGALALAFAILPLAAIAAVSTGLRVGQYGLTPARLWALTFIAFACAVGLAYWAALARRRLAWATPARPANIALAIGLCAVMLLLSTPIVSFGALSARSQVARLEAGRVSPERFDWAALRYDFGPAGKAAVERLAKSGTPAIRTAAARTLDEKDRWALAQRTRDVDAKAAFAGRVTVLPEKAPLPDALVDAILREGGGCGRNDDRGRCIVRHVDGSGEAVVLSWRAGCEACAIDAAYFVRGADGKWEAAAERWPVPPPPAEAKKAQAAAERAAAERGEIEVRQVTRRQVFVGGRPVGTVFE